MPEGGDHDPSARRAMTMPDPPAPERTNPVRNTVKICEGKRCRQRSKTDGESLARINERLRNLLEHFLGLAAVCKCLLGEICRVHCTAVSGAGGMAGQLLVKVRRIRAAAEATVSARQASQRRIEGIARTFLRFEFH